MLMMARDRVRVEQCSVCTQLHSISAHIFLSIIIISCCSARIFFSTMTVYAMDVLFVGYC